MSLGEGEEGHCFSGMGSGDLAGAGSRRDPGSVELAVGISRGYSWASECLLGAGIFYVIVWHAQGQKHQYKYVQRRVSPLCCHGPFISSRCLLHGE